MAGEARGEQVTARQGWQLEDIEAALVGRNLGEARRQHPLGVGIDLAECPRVDALLSRAELEATDTSEEAAGFHERFRDSSAL